MACNYHTLRIAKIVNNLETKNKNATKHVKKIVE